MAELPVCDFVPEEYRGPSKEEVLALRKKYLHPSLVLFYKDPVLIVDGHMQYVWNEKGERYLDLIGGIVTVSVGHSHPDVIKAGVDQMKKFQHSANIYLHDKIATYAEKLMKQCPEMDDPVVYFVNSGSEANALAMEMARVYTGNFDGIALRNGYHGMGAAEGLTAHGSWKQNSPQGFGVHHALCPDMYKGAFAGLPDAVDRYVKDVQDLIATATPRKLGFFIAEPIQGVGGTVPCPEGYLKRVYEIVRSAGGLCIADEVQTGFCRLGTAFWGWQDAGVVPDIVTCAKGIGNGAGIAAVIASRKVAAAFTGATYFNTFGGNPVTSAIGEAVLDVLIRDDYKKKCREVGGHLLARLNELKEKHVMIGDVRGKGLMVGCEFVKDRVTKIPASAECATIFEELKNRSILIGKGGLSGNTLRIKPPMCLSKGDVDYFIEVLDELLKKYD